METKNYSIFDNIKNLDQNGNPYWTSRELCKALGYSTYQKFSDGILQKARNEASSLSTDFKHFSRQVKMVKIGSGALREIEDFHLSKEACLTIAQKADSGKQQVVVAREYFKALNSCTTEIETHYDDCDDLNSVYIKKYTNRATKFYTDKIQELKERKLNGNISFVNDNSFRGIPSSHHIMYKLEPLESNDGMRKYEFLIEYKVTEPSVGIYYGCRGLIMKADDDDENEISKQQEIFDKQWDKIKDNVCTILNNTFPGKNFHLRVKGTDNANDRTYWPFWFSLYEDEDIVEVGARATWLIRKAYENTKINNIKITDYTGNEKFAKNGSDISNENKKGKTENNNYATTRTSFTCSAYDELTGLYDFDENKWTKFIRYLCDRGYLQPDEDYEKAWKICEKAIEIGDKKEKVTFRQNCFLWLVKRFIEENDAEFKPKTWRLVGRIFLNKKGKPLNYCKQGMYQLQNNKNAKFEKMNIWTDWIKMNKRI